MKFNTPVNTADHSDVVELQKRLMQAADKLSSMAGSVAQARQVREYDNDRRKRCLAVAALPLLTAGASSAAADTEARASEPYASAMKQLGAELAAAEKAIAEWEAQKIMWESARSLLAMAKSQMAIL